MNVSKTSLLFAFSALVLISTLPGCNQGNIRDETEAPVWLYVTTQSGGVYNVVSSAGSLTDDTLWMVIYNLPVGVESPDDIIQNPLEFPDTTYLNVRLLHYTVTFEAKDGGDLEGVDVPPGFRIAAGNQVVEFESSTDIETAIVRLHEKLQPPLNGLSGDPLPIDATAKVVFYGETLDGEKVSGSAEIDVQFWP